MPQSKSDVWQIIISAGIAFVLALVTALVTANLADPRADIKDIKANYLSLREHEEFVRRFTSDLERVERDNTSQNAQMASKVDLAAHDRTDDVARSALWARLDQMQRQIDLLITRSMTDPQQGRATNGGR